MIMKSMCKKIGARPRASWYDTIRILGITTVQCCAIAENDASALAVFLLRRKSRTQGFDCFR